MVVGLMNIETEINSLRKIVLFIVMRSIIPTKFRDSN